MPNILVHSLVGACCYAFGCCGFISALYSFAMKKVCFISLLLLLAPSLVAQRLLTVDSCRTLALANNKNLLLVDEQIVVAQNQRKVAHTKYLPHLSVTATYIRNEKEISLLSDEQKARLHHLGTNVGTTLQQTAQSLVAQYPTLAPLVQSLGTSVIAPLSSGLGHVGSQLVDGLRTDTRNMFAGVLSLTQPLYMGGKIRAYNKIAQLSENLAYEQKRQQTQEVILSVDQAYWQVVSLSHKKKLAESYLQLLRRLDGDVDKMIVQGVATRADGLTVKVKLNEAEMALLRVDDGLSLSRMLLCQLCGLELNSEILLQDEQKEYIAHNPSPIVYQMNEVFAQRSELKSLDLAKNIYAQKLKLTRAEHLPQLALVGNYLVTNPSAYNGFENRFAGMWNVGVMLKMPIWSWGEGKYKMKIAKAEHRMAEIRLSEAREKIELQVAQSSLKIKEAAKKLQLAEKNMEKAAENLHYAEVGFKEGVIATSNLLEAHTAWLSAQTDKIDAQIDVHLTHLYLQKALGKLSIE